VLVLVLVLVALRPEALPLRRGLLLFRLLMMWQMWGSVLLLTEIHTMRGISTDVARVQVTVICSGLFN
jgi:hypothetical protein